MHFVCINGPMVLAFPKEHKVLMGSKMCPVHGFVPVSDNGEHVDMRAGYNRIFVGAASEALR